MRKAESCGAADAPFHFRALSLGNELVYLLACRRVSGQHHHGNAKRAGQHYPRADFSYRLVVDPDILDPIGAVRVAEHGLFCSRHGVLPDEDHGAVRGIQFQSGGDGAAHEEPCLGVDI